jgi:hypothetical protein
VRDLRRAIALDPKYRADARKDSYFDPVRDDPAFRRLVSE